MKNFKIFLVEILIQFTILISISRYQRDSDRFEQLLKNSLLDFQTHNFINNNYNKKVFELDSTQHYSKDYIQDIIKYNNNNNNNNRQTQIYLNPSNLYLRVTDKFLEYPELQTKNSLVSFCNNANISPEDMDEIKRILFEQDIDVGVGFYNTEYHTGSFEKNFTNDITNSEIDFNFNHDNNDLNNLFNNNSNNNNNRKFDYFFNNKQIKPTIVFKTPKPILDEELIPDGYKKVIEEDTGEVFFIPTDDEKKDEIPFDIIEPKLSPEIGIQTFNPVTIERYASNSKELNDFSDNIFDDLYFDDQTNIKFNDTWLKNFMETNNSLQTQTNENMMASSSVPDTSSKHISNDFNFLMENTQDKQNNSESLIKFNDTTLSIVNNNNDTDNDLSYLNSMNDIIDDMLANTIDNNNNISQQVESLINNNNLYYINETENINNNNNDNNNSFIETFYLDSKVTNQNTTLSSSSSSLSSSSTIISSDFSSDSNDDNYLENQINNLKKEITSEDALYGILHNHTYLETNPSDVYHPHSYKNKLKNLLDSTNKESKDEALLTEYNIEFTLDSIVNSNVELFTEMLKNPKLTQEQLNVLRDIRRRGKNKIAAKTCRKRKIDSIDNLKDEVNELRNKKLKLELEREKIQEQMKQFAMKIDTIYKDLIGNNKDPSDPIRNYIENLLKQLNEKTGDIKQMTKGNSDKTPKNNKRK